MNERLKKLMGLLNTPMNQGGGLLGNIPQGALLGAAMYGQGIKGKDPLAGLFPAYMQTAQLQKMMTPEFKRPMAVKNKDTGEIRFIDPRKVTEDSPYVPLPKDEMTADMRNHEFYLNIQEKGTPAEKRAADLIFRKRGRDIATKDEYLLNITKNLSKDIKDDMFFLSNFYQIFI